jgi:hypothetical protein
MKPERRSGGATHCIACLDGAPPRRYAEQGHTSRPWGDEGQVMATTTADAHVQSAIDFLRRACREIEARAVEALLEPASPEESDSATPAEHALTLTEAANRLGMSPKAVRNRIESGLLVGVRPADSSEDMVTVSSIEQFEESTRLLALIAIMPGDQDEPLGPGEESLLSQMLQAARDEDREE